MQAAHYGPRPARQTAHQPVGQIVERGIRVTRAGGRGGQGAREGASLARPGGSPERQAQGARVRLTPLAALGIVTTACASMGQPPGAPPRLTPPAIILVSPDSGAVLPTLSGDAVIQFDEVIDEMAQGTGGAPGTVTGLAKQIVLSPVAGPVKVSWHRSAIHVKPKEGWKPGRVYHLQLLPGIIDLHRNILKRGETIIFSTGPA